MNRSAWWVIVGIWLGSLTGVSAISALGTSTQAPPATADVDRALVERFLQSGAPDLTSYAARRVLTASTRGGRMRATLEALTYLDPDGTFRFEVLREEGSGLIRRRVLMAALEAEQRSRRSGESAQAALAPANYDFEIAGPSDEGLVAIRLLPRRVSPMLIGGRVLVRPDSGDLVSVDGRLSKTPSWWTKRVDVVRRYARILGIRVPVEMRSEAQVRITGASSFSMIYEYSMINGQPVESGAVAAASRIY